MTAIKNLGIGIGLRSFHYDEIVEKKPKIEWFEIISENYLDDEEALNKLYPILESYPVVQHGVSLAIGSSTPLNFDYLKKLKALTKITKTPWISDHLCWGQMPGAHFHQLLPLPFTEEVIDYVVPRAKIVQDFLELPFALENISSYVSYNQNVMEEWEFYSEIVKRADIHMMLDVNNIYVSSQNLGFDAKEYIKKIPLEKVIQIHLAGHTKKEDVLIDSHDNYVKDEVWELYAEVYSQAPVSTLLEWDQHFISFEETWKEALKAKEFQKSLVLCG
jgi:uncharacterized protein (UPF0276 family)